MRHIVIVPLLMLALALAGKSAQAENVLYCQAELATGFAKVDGIWKEASFHPEWWTLKFNEDFTLLTGLDLYDGYFCEPRQSRKSDLIICRSAHWIQTPSCLIKIL